MTFIDILVVLLAIGIVTFGLYYRYKLKKNNVSPCASCSGCASKAEMTSCAEKNN